MNLGSSQNIRLADFAMNATILILKPSNQVLPFGVSLPKIMFIWSGSSYGRLFFWSVLGSVISRYNVLVFENIFTSSSLLLDDRIANHIPSRYELIQGAAVPVYSHIESPYPFSSSGSQGGWRLTNGARVLSLWSSPCCLYVFVFCHRRTPLLCSFPRLVNRGLRK